ncbi:small acid-soluble spore protein H [Alteribacillus bidgolensis]|uniref:Small, acid-soluble spore protein H n=1 Tax=Alteribacillus bidgolensis TaxID=930129 RepID=A0A1G8KXJ9_9BACI|nr:small acid-soluble spore protein H [Alteribacillus bidgolensis]SDI48126.1 small acid-soluble spore protein H (minor) [Alteribacillus bidgolensis]
MNVMRAQEISESPVMAHVTYDGTPIYIQHVDKQKHTARIYALDEPDNELEVSLDSLEES